MLALVVCCFYLKTTGVADRLFEDGDKVLDNGRPVVIDHEALPGALDFGGAVALDGKADPPAARVIRCKPVHVKDGEVDPGRCLYHDFALFRAQPVGILLKAERLCDLAGKE